MNTKVLLAALAGAVTTFLTGWLIYGIALKGFFEGQMVESAKGVMRPEVGMLHIFLGCLSWALLFALVFSRWAIITTFKTGAIAGSWMGFVVAWPSGRREEGIYARVKHGFESIGHKWPLPDGLKAMLPVKSPLFHFVAACKFPYICGLN